MCATVFTYSLVLNANVNANVDVFCRNYSSSCCIQPHVFEHANDNYILCQFCLSLLKYKLFAKCHV